MRLVRSGAVLAVGWAALLAPPTRAATEVCVGVVVDFGADPGAPAPRVSRRCVKVPPGSTGAEVLKARGDVRFEGNFVCGIDGYPATGCGDRPTGGVTRYWSYWQHSGGSWRYATYGAAEHRVEDADRDGYLDLEGWHFITSSGATDRTAPPAATYAEICPEAVRPAASSPAPAPTTPPPAGGPPARPAPATSAPAVVTPTDRPVATRSGAPVPGTPAPPAPATPTASPLAEPSRAATRASGGGSAAGLLAGALLVGVLAAGAVWQARR